MAGGCFRAVLEDCDEDCCLEDGAVLDWDVCCEASGLEVEEVLVEEDGLDGCLSSTFGLRSD